MNALHLPTKGSNPYVDLAQIKADYEANLITARGAVMFALRLLTDGRSPLHIGNMAKFAKRLGPSARVVRMAINRLATEGFLSWKESNGIDLWASDRPPTAEPDKGKVAQRRIEPKGGSIDPNADQLILPVGDRSIQNGINRSYQKRSKRLSKGLFKRSSRLYIYNSPSFKERREREKARKNSFSRESEPLDRENPVTVEATQTPSTPPTPPPSPAAFDWTRYDWGSYSEPGSGGSDPVFWAYTRQKVVQVARERREQGHPNQIGDVDAYALGMIRRQGRDRYEAFLVARGVLPPPPPKQPAIAAPAATPAQPSDPMEQWRQAHQTLNKIWESGAQDDVFATLQLYLKTRPGMPADPDKVRWLVQQSPHWGYQFVGGQLVKPAPTDDLTEVIAQIGVHLRRLGWDKAKTTAHLQQTYGKTRAMLDDAELCDFLFYLESGGGP